jgi:hypothetical protein
MSKIHSAPMGSSVNESETIEQNMLGQESNYSRLYISLHVYVTLLMEIGIGPYTHHTNGFYLTTLSLYSRYFSFLYVGFFDIGMF